ncbi:MAG: hypothetical protein KDA32_09310, partial [Phycisphaerales bacterium]|nr:hypothetical protein [Phycisphaerales bacterium]
VNAKYAKHGLQVISVSIDKSIPQCRAYIQSQRMDWVHVCDGKGEKTLTKTWGVNGVPSLFLIDEEGIYRGRAYKSTMDNQVADLLRKMAEKKEKRDAAGSDKQSQAGDKEAKRKPEAPKPGDKPQVVRCGGCGPGVPRAKTLLDRADFDLKKERYLNAYEGFEKLIAECPESAEAKTARERIDMMLADKQIAARVESERAERRAAQAENLIKMARTLRDAKNAESAKKYYSRVIAEYPDTRWAPIAREEMSKLE